MKNENTPVTPVRYYVGDLCYVMHDVWEEVCDLLDFDNETNFSYELSDGRKFFALGTAYGDGTYFDNHGRSYPVDAGLIGAIKLNDITDPEMVDSIFRGCGHIIEFPRELENDDVYDDKGVLCFDHVSIDTASEDDEDEYDEDTEEDG